MVMTDHAAYDGVERAVHYTVDSTHVLDSLQQAYQNSAYPLLSKLRCEIVDEKLVISGVLPSYFLKQISQEIALQFEKKREIQNQIQVRYHG